MVKVLTYKYGSSPVCTAVRRIQPSMLCVRSQGLHSIDLRV